MSTVKSAHKVLKVLKALRGHSLTGVSIKELSEQLNETPSQIYRALQTLIEEGLAVQLDNEKYAQGKFFIQAAHAHAEEIERAQGHINQHLQQIFAGVRQINTRTA